MNSILKNQIPKMGADGINFYDNATKKSNWFYKNFLKNCKTFYSEQKP